MQDLRLVGVQDDAEHVLLADSAGNMYRVRIDEALRTASSRKPHPAGGATGATAVEALSPREIQSRIRSGATAEEVAESSGLELSHVQRYEGPVLAERAHIATLAAQTLVSDALPAHDGYRSAFGDEPARLGEMVSYRLNSMGLDTDSLQWDAWRRSDGKWTVVASFEADSPAAKNIGEAAPAQWSYAPASKSVQNLNRWAQVLSEIEPMDAPLPARRLSAVADRPFDFETDQPAGTDSEQIETEGTQEDPADSSAEESDALLSMLRSRRGRRLGTDVDEDDALAVLLGQNIPPAHPRPHEAQKEENKEQDPEEKPADDAGSSAQRPSLASIFPGLGPKKRPADADTQAAPGTESAPKTEEPTQTFLDLSEGVSSATHEVVISAEPVGASQKSDQQKSQTKESDSNAEESETKESSTDGPGEDEPKRAQVKPKRSSVPSWDEIVFGTKSD